MESRRRGRMVLQALAAQSRRRRFGIIGRVYKRLAGKRWYSAARAGKVSRWRGVMKRRSVRLAAGGMAVLLVATLFFTLFQQKHASAATWWSPNWKYRRQITFNNSASSTNLDNFPVRVALTTGNFDYTK